MGVEVVSTIPLHFYKDGINENPVPSIVDAYRELPSRRRTTLIAGIQGCRSLRIS